jgi:hypothetical protein
MGKRKSKLTYPLKPTMSDAEFNRLQHVSAQGTLNRMEQRWARK